jgi:periplasmic glucans biosynthesis protein
MEQTALIRGLLVGLAVTLLAGSISAQPRREKVNFTTVDTIAKELASAPHQESEASIPEKLRTMSYSSYRSINFDASKALWSDQDAAFQAQFFHPGFLFTQPVRLFEYTDSHVQEIPFLSSFFVYYQDDYSEDLPRDLGFAGFRIHSPVNTPEIFDELIAFLGASYFRAVSSNLNYGLSARGVSVGTGVEENFPRFSRFWLKKPEPADTDLTVLALLEGETITGAYEFNIQPGLETVVEVHARLYARTDFRDIGLAPLTSMFWFGENTRNKPDDWRPEVHDSDGLLIHCNKDLLWRPLMNVRRSHLEAIRVEELRGFGLMQRDRNFENFQDLEARYDNRPSAWIEPIGSWGEGHIHLLELATNNEMMDNVVAFWRPDVLPTEGEPIEVRYRIIWGQDPAPQAKAKVVATRSGPTINRAGATSFIIDFSPTRSWPDEIPVAAIIPHLTTTAGEVVNGPILVRNPVNKTLRMFFDMIPAADVDVVHLRAHLSINDSIASEIWTYRWEQ